MRYDDDRLKLLCHDPELQAAVAASLDKYKERAAQEEARLKEVQAHRIAGCG